MKITATDYFDSDLSRKINEESVDLMENTLDLKNFKMELRRESVGLYRVILKGDVNNSTLYAHSSDRDVLHAFRLARKKFKVQVNKVIELKKSIINKSKGGELWSC